MPTKFDKNDYYKLSDERNQGRIKRDELVANFVIDVKKIDTDYTCLSKAHAAYAKLNTAVESFYYRYKKLRDV